MFDILYAAETAADTVQTQAQTANPLSSLMPLILLFVLFYFFLIRPHQKKSKQHKDMLNSLQKGDTVITSGGILGQIVGLKDNMLELKIAENVNIRMLKDSISRVVPAAGQQQ